MQRERNDLALARCALRPSNGVLFCARNNDAYEFRENRPTAVVSEDGHQGFRYARNRSVGSALQTELDVKDQCLGPANLSHCVRCRLLQVATLSAVIGWISPKVTPNISVL